MVVDYLPTMRCRHSSCTPGDLIEWCPKRFDGLSIYLSGTFNEARRVSRQASVLMPMNVKEANGQSELQVIGFLEIVAAGHPLHHMNTPLTHNIVRDEGGLYSVHIKVQGFEYGVVHVSLTVGGPIYTSLLR